MGVNVDALLMVEPSIPYSQYFDQLSISALIVVHCKAKLF